MKLLVTAITAKPIGSSTVNGYFPVNRYKLWNTCCNNQPGRGTRRNLAKKLSLRTQKSSGVVEIKASLPEDEFVSLQTVSCYPN
jgi:hypothetical protein